MSTQETAPSGPVTGTEAKDRATEFRAVEGGPETKSGEMLLVQAYVIIWILLFAFLALIWRRQKALLARLDVMDRALDRATAAPPKAP